MRVAPARERGLKYMLILELRSVDDGRSREGAWIEMSVQCLAKLSQLVAPARERGLKCKYSLMASTG